MASHTLEITLLRAQDLPVSDFGFMGMGGKSDPYVVFKVGRVNQKSSIIKKNLSPVWSPPEKFAFELDRPKEAVLEVLAYDHDTANQDDLLGTASLALAPFADRQGRAEPQSYELDVPASFKHKKRAFVFLEIKVLNAAHAGRVLELWENQRYHLIKKWTTDTVLPKDRKRWSDVNDADSSSDSFEEVAPRVPAGMTAEGWTLDVSQGDDQGWMYAPSFQGPWEKKSFSLAMVRRRKWINKCTVEPNGASGSGGAVAY